MPGIAPSFGSGIFIDAIFAQQGHPPAASADCPGVVCPGMDWDAAALDAPPHIMPSAADVACAVPVADACSIMPHPAAAAGKVPMAVNAAAAKTRFLMGLSVCFDRWGQCRVSR
ncbi:hypothetical protein [Antarcticirhabdus aurantiaca]|uniref:Uncharacterized protein n=1 Tax=Antarcticirhabdus aurantiaca TaxID=2606717 RepID=A0ACD4NXR1_9HYPH|nr:hypothetical protein OXU80_17400 [Jeongeuplla avenae]